MVDMDGFGGGGDIDGGSNTRDLRQLGDVIPTGLLHIPGINSFVFNGYLFLCSLIQFVRIDLVFLASNLI